ncbi:MGMT family protein [Natrialba swarupiae]|uniref:Methylated-DNA--[protein]-cysteine S-methyltransferase n=1 Tax=Natrialba swarupiae TaxID=2448032 RepID=A0A5D5ANS1_9EURY|nr:MGMT family protein [Natrialba swarupiae]TYT63468.1 methylated-DNA--[protein]-cysteine S-methyltransferase [Natrialba swarupiae]
MDDADAGIYARESSYLDRYVQVGAASGRVISVSFPDLPDEEAVDDDHPVLERIFEYLDGLEPVTFEDVQVGLTIPTDQRAVLEQVQGIPYGDQVTVESLVRMTPDLDPDDEDDVILVRTALAENPTPLLIPDHRIRDGPSAAPPQVEQKFRSLEEL